MSASDRGISFVRRLRARAPGWVWFSGLAFAWGVVPVVLAFTVHDRCRASDPACVFGTYTLVQAVGPGILGFVGAPAVISLVVVALLHVKATRGSMRADRVAWFLAVLSCIIALVGLFVEGVAMLPVAGLTVCAVATAPLKPNPADPLAGSGGVLRRLPPPD